MGGMAGMLSLSACCLSDGGCGGGLGMLAALAGGGGPACLDTSPGTSDPSCPSQPTPLGIALTGCCSATKICGADLSMLGLGCNSLSAFGGFLMTDSGPPRPCGDAGGRNTDGGEGGVGVGGDAGGDARTSDSGAHSGGQDAAQE
jgi:hypothetical protein